MAPPSTSELCGTLPVAAALYVVFRAAALPPEGAIKFAGGPTVAHEVKFWEAKAVHLEYPSP